MKRFVSIARMVTILLIVAIPIGAHVPRRVLTSAGVAYEKWSDSSMPVVWRLNPARGSNVTGSRDVLEVARLAFHAWSGVSTARIAFSEGATTTLNNAALDGVNLISFLPATYNMDAAALTVVYSVSQGSTDALGRRIEFPGQILEADILLNPNVQFSTDTTPAPGRIDLQSQLTHEIGHLLGLDHSGLLSAVMSPSIPPATNHLRVLSADDVLGISMLYPAGSFSAGRGTLTGTVTNPAGAPVFAAHVVVVDAAGKPVASTLTNSDGMYYVHGLESGNYSVYAEPLDGPVTASSIPSLGAAYPDRTVADQFTTRFAIVSAAAALTLTKTGGDTQTGDPGIALAAPLEIEVRDALGALKSGIVVMFSAASGGGAVVPIAAVTDSQGRARTTAYMGLGQTQAFRAIAGSSSVLFTANRRSTTDSATQTALSAVIRVVLPPTTTVPQTTASPVIRLVSPLATAYSQTVASAIVRIVSPLSTSLSLTAQSPIARIVSPAPPGSQIVASPVVRVSDSSSTPSGAAFAARLPDSERKKHE